MILYILNLKLILMALFTNTLLSLRLTCLIIEPINLSVNFTNLLINNFFPNWVWDV